MLITVRVHIHCLANSDHLDIGNGILLENNGRFCQSGDLLDAERVT